MELLSRPYIEETEEQVSVLEAKKDTNSACNVSQDWNQASLTRHPSSPPRNNEPLSSPTSLTAVHSTPVETFPKDSFRKDSTEDPPVGANDANHPPKVFDTASVSTAVANPTGAFISDYTTMELFQQITNVVFPDPSSAIAATARVRQEYFRQSLSLSENSGVAPEPTELSFNGV